MDGSSTMPGVPLTVRIPPLHGETLQSLLGEPWMGLGRETPEAMGDVRRRLSPVRAFRPDQLAPASIGKDIEVANKAQVQEEPKAKPRPPAWLEGTYRPRKLTEAGVHALNCLGPDGNGLHRFLRQPLLSTAVHRDVLAARYVALDMVQRGLAFEARGSYHHIDELFRRDGCAFESTFSLCRSENVMASNEILKWLAIARVMMLDQFIMVDPENARNNVNMLLRLADEGLVRERTVVMGQGTVSMWQLTRKGWNLLSKGDADLKSRGFGPMRPLSWHEDTIFTSCSSGRYAVHQVWQMDAILWFKRDLEDRNLHLTDLWLAGALAAMGGNEKEGRILDFRMHWAAEDGRQGSFDVEVVGVGNSYRSAASIQERRTCVAIRCFSGASNHIEHCEHVTIGR